MNSLQLPVQVVMLMSSAFPSYGTPEYMQLIKKVEVLRAPRFNNTIDSIVQ